MANVKYIYFLFIEWKEISDMIPSRSIVQVRTHAQKFFQKIAKVSFEKLGKSVPDALKSTAINSAYSLESFQEAMTFAKASQAKTKKNRRTRKEKYKSQKKNRLIHYAGSSDMGSSIAPSEQKSFSEFQLDFDFSPQPISEDMFDIASEYNFCWSNIKSELYEGNSCKDPLIQYIEEECKV